MDGESQRSGGQGPWGSGESDARRSVQAALASVDEAERYRLLASVFSELAEKQAAGASSRSTAEIEAISRRVQALTEEKASLRDRCAAIKADLDHRTTQLEAEQKRGRELQTINEEQRSRLDSLQKQVADLEVQLTARSAEIHKAHAEHDSLLLRVQRAELERDDRSKVDRIEASKREAAKEVELLRREIEQLRAERDATIARLEEELTATRGAKAGGGEASFGVLWSRLASAKPALVQGHVKPTEQSLERLVDAFIELVRFVDDFDKLIRPFLSKYTKHHQPVKVPWEVYAKRDDTLATVQQTLAPVGGKPVGVIKIQLRGLYVWTEAAMIACDAVLESIGAELHEWLHGPSGTGSDPNRTIRDFLRDDGHEKFLEHIRELRGLRLAEAFGRRG